VQHKLTVVKVSKSSICAKYSSSIKYHKLVILLWDFLPDWHFARAGDHIQGHFSISFVENVPQTQGISSFNFILCLSVSA